MIQKSTNTSGKEIFARLTKGHAFRMEAYITYVSPILIRYTMR